MTLIYGGADDDIGFLISDTLVSFEKDRAGDNIRFNEKNHILKIHILNGRIAVAFAGDIKPALKLINELKIGVDSNQINVEVPDRLFQLYKNHKAEVPLTSINCEFLILEITDRGRKLAKVDEKGYYYCARAYIGDSEEHKKLIRRPYQPPNTILIPQPDGSFQEEQLVITKGEIDFNEISNAMEDFTYQLKSKSVGAICGCITRVVDAKPSGELEYLQSIESGISPEEGNFGYTYLSSNINVRGIGIYYRAGKVGFLFIVGDSEFNRKEYADTLSQFIELAHKNIN
ncbi:MAG TPA: hypothetical protein PK657_03580 [Legionella sp.]|nr:hypothetical protein [Legionella sp.]